MEKKTDFLGNELKIGDKVVFMRLNYRTLSIGIIKSMSNKMIMIKNISSRGEIRQRYDQVVKII